MKAAVQFKGVWQEEEGGDRLAVCIKDTPRYKSGDISMVHHSCIREYWEILCTREQFESFVAEFYVTPAIIGDTPEQLKEGVQPEAPYVPKVGKECEVSVDGGMRWYKFVKTDKRNLILDESWGEMLEGLYVKFRPLRTEREIFIEKAVEDYLDQVGANAVNKKWFGRIFGAMYDSGYTKGEVK